jgi:DNA-binding transcriptional MerR regulator
MNEDLFTAGDIARQIGCSDAYIIQLERKGIIPRARRVGRTRAYTQDEVDAIKKIIMDRVTSRWPWMFSQPDQDQ